MKIKQAKPGRYKPTCGKCHQPFMLRVQDEPTGGFEVKPLPRKPPNEQPTRVEEPAPIEQTMPLDRPAAIDETAPLNIAHDVTVIRQTDRTIDAGGAVAKSEPINGDARPEQLGGYKILSVLGRGAMGTVYLANQTSLDRQVALKTIQAQWCKTPATVARFTREAYAAAQLTHHNVVQIYDLGTDHGVNFYSMEFVNGVSLAELVQQQGKLDPETAVGYILQAARGLSFAHDHGMVHRDVKPANLMLSDLGIVKVADLGLVKTPQMVEEENATAERSALAASTASVTLANMAIGTPAYMAPEQAENATGVDHRADIYSLGCTLYVLLTGRTPFEGATALEVITKHRTEQVVRPDQFDTNIPGPISDVVVRMIAKNPDDRFANLDEVIVTLEAYLGSAARPIGEEQVSQLENHVAQYNSAPAAKLRRLVAMGFVLAMAVLAVGSALFSVTVASGWIVMLVAAAASYFVISGHRGRAPLFSRFRELLFALRWTEWLTGAIGTVVVLAVLVLAGPVVVWFGFALVGAIAGAVLHFVFDRQLAVARREPLDAVEALLKKLRIRGMDESELQQFVAKFGGDAWEEFFEALFGYDAKLTARLALQQDGQRPRKQFRGWRDPLMRRISDHLGRTRATRDRKHLEDVEAAALQATGLTGAQARQQAASMAAAMIDHAAAARREFAAEVASHDPNAAAEMKRQRIKSMLAEARSGKFAKPPSPTRWLAGTLSFFLGAKLRFLVGSALLAGCLLWMRQLGWFADDETLGQLDAVNLLGPSEPLHLPVIGILFNSFNPGMAGVLLLFTTLFRGWKMTLFALPAAGIMVLGPSLGLPGIAALGGAHTTSLVLGGAVAVVGLLFGRTGEEIT